MSIVNLYLPFFEYDIYSLFSLFTALNCINYNQTVWLPPYEDINDVEELKKLMQECMDKLTEEYNDYCTFDIERVVNTNRIKFYTQDQIIAIQNQHSEFYNFVKRNSLEKYMNYINFDNRPEWLTQHKWDNYVLPLKAEAEKLMAVMRCEQVPEEKNHDSNGMNELMAAAINISFANEENIAHELATRGLQIQNVTGDGNCGIYALLAGLHPDQAENYSHVRPSTEEGTPWQNAANLRRELFGNDNALGQMVDGNNQLNRWLALDNNEALQTVNTYVRNQGRSSLVILDTTVTAESGVAFTAINENGEQIRYNTLNDALNAAGNNPLMLVYTPNHWKAVVPSNK